MKFKGDNFRTRGGKFGLHYVYFLLFAWLNVVWMQSPILTFVCHSARQGCTSDELQPNRTCQSFIAIYQEPNKTPSFGACQ